MSNRPVTCIYCGARKNIGVHKKGYIGPENVVLFQIDGWTFLQGRKGICAECPRLKLETVNAAE